MKKIVMRASRFLNSIACFGIVATMALVTINVLLKNVLKHPILGTYEYVGFLTGAVIGLSLAYCALQKGHLAIGLLVDKLNPRTQAIISTFTNGVTSIFLFFASYRLFLYARRLWLSGEVSATTETPFYPFVYMVAIGLSVFSLVILLELAKSFQRVISK